MREGWWLSLVALLALAIFGILSLNSMRHCSAPAVHLQPLPAVGGAVGTATPAAGSSTATPSPAASSSAVSSLQQRAATGSSRGAKPKAAQATASPAATSSAALSSKRGGRPPAASKIPRIIHHMHANESALSPLQAMWRKRCLELHPDWEFKFWNDTALEAFIKKDFSWYYPTWKEIQPFIKKLDSSRCAGRPLAPDRGASHCAPPLLIARVLRALARSLRRYVHLTTSGKPTAEH